ncbi:unnamed protein product [Rhodiola kirilowii]
MSHAGSIVGDNSQNNEVEQVQNGEIRGAIPGQFQQQQNQNQPQYPQYPQYPPPYQQYPPPPYPQYPQPLYPQYPPQYPPLPYHPQHPYPPPQRPPRQPVVRDDEDDANEGPTMGELSVPNFRDQAWCIYEGPDLAAITVNTAVIHHLPKFSGTKGESATTHLQRYHGICQNLKSPTVEVEDFKLKAFYFSLTDSASDWFLSLPSGSIYTWDQMQRAFLAKYYPAGRAMQVRRQLQDLRQGPNETMYEYVEKFNALEKSCCNLGLTEKLLVEYMLDGLRRLDRKLLDASAGGNQMNLSPAGVRRKIMEVAENERFQDESNKEEEYTQTRNVSKVEPSVNAMAEQIKELKEMMQHVIRRQPVQTKPCGFCAATDHKIDECPTLVEDDQAEINVVGDYQNYGNRPGPVRQYGAATTNQGANEQPWKNNNQQHQAQREPARQNAPQQTQQPYRHPNHQYQQNAPGQYQQRGQNSNQPGPSNHSSNKPLEEIMSQLTTLVSDLTNSVSAGRLPSQTVQNPRGNVSQVEVVDATFEESIEVVAPEGHMTEKADPEGLLVARPTQSDPIMRQPLSTGHETPLEKSKDTGAFTVTCGIGETQIPHCLIDLGAAINVMPYSLYCSLKLGPLKPPRLMIELGDRSCTRPDGLLENLTLRVGDLLVPADFYVLQMGDSRNDVPPALILGRPFLHTTKTQIDMGIGLLSLTFGGKKSNFYVYEDANRPCTRKPPDIVHTSDYDTLVPDPPEQTIQTTRPAAMAKIPSPSQGYVKKKPPDHWRAGSSEQLEEHVGRTEGEAEKKYDLTHPWDPNL